MKTKIKMTPDEINDAIRAQVDRATVRIAMLSLPVKPSRKSIA
jgi:hypothetical protein